MLRNLLCICKANRTLASQITGPKTRTPLSLSSHPPGQSHFISSVPLFRFHVVRIRSMSDSAARVNTDARAYQAESVRAVLSNSSAAADTEAAVTADANTSIKDDQSTKKNESTAYGYANRKRKQQDRKGKAKSEKKKNFRRKYSKDEDPGNSIPNKGSYADPEMCKLFGVTVETKAETQATATDSQPVAKVPKKKVAILVAFIGERYSGFQINPAIKSIQAEMDLALYRAGYLSQANFGFPQKYGWSNSARTDKGVHAVAQVVSCWLQLPTTNMDEVRQKINAVLPDDICVLDLCRTTRNFCARTQRDRVRYMYLLPSFLLNDTEAVRKLFESKGCHENNRPANDPLSEDEIQALLPDVTKYRATPENIDKLKRALGAYKGTHMFHNFTQGKKSTDGSCKRYIEFFNVLDPIVGEDGMEWIPTLVLGQSFLLNQIRKMVSLAVDVARGAAAMSVTEDSMTRRIMKLGLAPPHGLFLDMSFFGTYNEKKKPDQPLDWTSEDSPAVQRWRQFKEERVMQHIMTEETKENNFLRYLYVQEYHFERDRYLPLSSRSSESVELSASSKSPKDIHS
mmetsp:Transcript_38866/g.85295  ORF Transcript_38866/g.85295 Transcript_38866/m.85295 type:complete len:571 (-) Transcript_38866:159-1871(-)